MTWQKSRDDRARDAEVYGPTYRRNRKTCLQSAGHRCQIRIAGVCVGRATQADHIVPASAGGGDELSNLRAACTPCHRKVTAQQGGGYRGRSKPAPDPQPRPGTVW
jgi:5-methylcytosine-specific restriction endonuclease McrA